MIDHSKPIFNQSTQEIYEDLLKLTNAVNQPLVDLSAQENFKVNLIPDTKVAPALFVPDKSKPGQYKAHPDTIRALRKDIFVSDPDLLDRSLVYQCVSCHHELDLQFWHFCPYCLKEFKA